METILNNQDYSLIEQEDEGAITASSFDRYVYHLAKDIEFNLPIQEHFLRQLPLDAQEPLSQIYTQTEARPFSEYFNVVIPVLGMILEKHDTFRGKDGNWHDSYYSVKILLDKRDENGNYIVVKSSSRNLAIHVLKIVESKGWFLFDAPINYRFARGSNGQHCLQSQDMQFLKKGGKKEK